MKKRFTDQQIISILREAETGDVSIKALCNKHNITEQTFFCNEPVISCSGVTLKWKH